MDDDKNDDDRLTLREMTPRQQRVTLAFVRHLTDQIRDTFRHNQITAEVKVQIVSHGFDFTVVCEPQVYTRAYDLAQAVYDNVVRQMNDTPTH